MSSLSLPRPAREFRAIFEDETVTVYLAYSRDIADPAVNGQALFECMGSRAVTRTGTASVAVDPDRSRATHSDTIRVHEDTVH
jgi:hypothetical protein